MDKTSVYLSVINGATDDYNSGYYMLLGNCAIVLFNDGINLTSNSDAFSFTVPFISVENKIETIAGIDNGVLCVLKLELKHGSNIVDVYKDNILGKFTPSGRKGIMPFSFEYKVNTK